jgi:hypothetical protein
MQIDFSINRMIHFIRKNWMYIALFPLVMIWGTFVHEGAHALATIAQGGEANVFHILPNYDLGRFTYGFVTLKAPADANSFLIASAPYLLAFFTALVTGLLLWRFGGSKHLRIIYVFFFVLPVVDLAKPIFGLSFGSTGSDLYWIFEKHRLLAALGIGTVVAALGVLGWLAFERCWTKKITKLEFAVGYILILLMPLVPLLIDRVNLSH